MSHLTTRFPSAWLLAAVLTVTTGGCGPEDVVDTLYGANVVVTITPPAGASASQGNVTVRLADPPRWTMQQSISTVAPGPATVTMTLMNFAAMPFESDVEVIADPPVGSGWMPDTVLVQRVQFTSDARNTVPVALSWQ